MVIDHKFSNTGVATILELLQSRTTFAIPRFQRNYSWTGDKVAALWKDIIENYNDLMSDPEKSRELQYLLGPVVLVKNEKENGYFIIDGQQRLSTLTLLFCVARDILYDFSQRQGSDRPDLTKILDMIQNTNMGKHHDWKLILNNTDRIFFQKLQDYNQDSKLQIEFIKKLQPTLKSHKNLVNTYKFLYKQIINFLIKNTQKDIEYDLSEAMNKLDGMKIYDIKEKLMSFIMHVQENNFLIKIMVSDYNTAFQIFETLNERGQTLSKSDLIKNYILNQIENKNLQNTLSDTWDNIFEQITKNQPDDEFVMESFRSRYFKTNRSRKISIKNMYKIIFEEFKGEDECKKYIHEIESDADFLNKLNDPMLYDHESTMDDIYAIKELRAKFIRTPILAAYRTWGYNEEYTKMVKSLVKFFFRFKVVAGEHPGSVEKAVMEVTKNIMEQKLSCNEIINNLKAYDNNMFKINFERKFMIKPTTESAKYVLRQIELHLRKKLGGVKPMDDLDVEHILPKSHEKWNNEEFFKDYQGSDQNKDDFVGRLGNLTLLHKLMNIKIRNSKFDTKNKLEDEDKNCIGYKGSELKINEKISEQSEWTANSIIEREKELLDNALQIWNVKNTYLS